MNVGARVWAAALGALVCAAGCADLGQVAVVEARKSIRVPIEGVEVDVPEPRLDALVDDGDVARLLGDMGFDAEDVRAAVGGSLLDLARVQAVVPIAEALSGVVLDRLREEIEEGAADVLDSDTMHLEVDLAAWDGFTLDPADPDASIARALERRPVALRLVIEAESLEALVTGEAGVDVSDELDRARELADLDVLRGLHLREVGLRALGADEIEPEDGWSDAQRARVEAALADEARLARCDPERPMLDGAVAAEITVQSLRDPFAYATLAEVAQGDAKSLCALRIGGEALQTDLVPYLDGGLRIVVSLRATLGVRDHWLGGYLDAGVEGRFRLPGSLTDLDAI